MNCLSIKKEFAVFRILILIVILIAAIPKLSSAENDQELFLVAQKAFEDGFYDVSIRYIEELLDKHPDTGKMIQAKLLLGQCYFFKTQYLKAYDVFQSLLKYSEFKDATLFWLGETYLKGSDYSQAEKQYIKVIELYKKSIYTAQAYYSLGWSYFEQNKYEKAKKMFLTLLAKYPDHQLAEDSAFKLGEIEYQLKNYKDAIDFLDSYMQKYPNSPKQAEASFYIAEAYYYLDDPLTAITYYAKSAESAYDNSLVLMSKISLGWSYLKLQKYKLSAKYFDEAEQLAKEKNIPSDDVYFGQASLYSETQEYDKAIKSYQILIKDFPESNRIGEALLGLANIYYSTGKYPKAIEAYKNTISTLEKDKETGDIYEKAFFGLAWSYLKNSQIDKSIKTFKKIKDSSSNKIVKISAMAQIGDAYQDLGEYEKAIEVYDQILSENPESPYADYVQYRQGVALLQLNKLEAATMSFQSLQANFPDSKYLNDVKYYLSVSYFKQGDWSESKEYSEKFLKTASNENEFLEDAYYILVLSYYNLKEYAEAIKKSQAIKKDFPRKENLISKLDLVIAKSYYRMKKVKEAISRFEDIISSSPRSEYAQESLIWLGDHYLQTAEYNKAIENYLQVIKDFPGSEKIDIVNYEIGQAYQAKEDLENALKYFKKITSGKDKELFAKANMAIADIFSQNLDPEKSLTTYEKMLSSSPEFNKDTYVKIAETHKAEKEYSEAIEAYKKALDSKQGSSKTKNSKIQFSIGDSYEFLNKPDKAVEQYLKIPYLYPKDIAWVTKAYLRIARIFEDEEKWNDAILTYNKIIQLGSDEESFAKERINWIKQNFYK